MIASIGNPMLPNLIQATLGMDAGAGFGWQDMTGPNSLEVPGLQTIDLRMDQREFDVSFACGF